jgi:hypothetical protein
MVHPMGAPHMLNRSFFVLGAIFISGSSTAASFTVDTTQNLDSVFLRVCSSAPADCSFLGAITLANANSDRDTIAFNIPSSSDSGCNASSGVCGIDLPAGIVSITQPITIDGYTQPGATPNTLSADGFGVNMQLRVELRRYNLTAQQNGLRFFAAATVRGLALDPLVSSALPNAMLNFAPTLNDQTVEIEGNTFGFTALGMAPANNSALAKYVQTDCFMSGEVRSLRFGGLLPAQRNWLQSGFPALKFSACGTTPVDVLVQGNLFGTSKNGLSALNGQLNSFRWIEQSYAGTPNIEIGGADPAARNVFVRAVAQSIFEPNTSTGATATKVFGNYFGLGVDGITPLTVPIDPQRPGNTVLDIRRARIGGIAPGEGNRFVGNWVGVMITNPTTNSVRGNTFVNNLTAAVIRHGQALVSDFHPARVQINSFSVSSGSVNLNYQVPSSSAQATYPLTVEFYQAGPTDNNPSVFLGRDTYTAAEATQPKAVIFALAPNSTLNSEDVVIASASAANDNGTGEFNWYPVLLSFVGNGDAVVSTFSPIRVRLQGLGPVRPRGTVLIADSSPTTNFGTQTCLATLAPSPAGPYIAEGECNLFMREPAPAMRTLYATYQSTFENFRSESGAEPTASRPINVTLAPVDFMFCDGFESPLRCAGR